MIKQNTVARCRAKGTRPYQAQAVMIGSMGSMKRPPGWSHTQCEYNSRYAGNVNASTSALRRTIFHQPTARHTKNSKNTHKGSVDEGVEGSVDFHSPGSEMQPMSLMRNKSPCKNRNTGPATGSGIQRTSGAVAAAALVSDSDKDSAGRGLREIVSGRGESAVRPAPPVTCAALCAGAPVRAAVDAGAFAAALTREAIGAEAA